MKQKRVIICLSIIFLNAKQAVYHENSLVKLLTKITSLKIIFTGNVLLLLLSIIFNVKNY